MPVMKKAGSVKMAPEATLPPIEPIVLAVFSSRIVPRKALITAIPTTAVV